MKDAGLRHTLMIIGGAVLIVGASLVAYIPAMRAGFIWDDDAYVTENPLVSAPDGLWRIWFTKDSPSQYFPMVYTTFRFEYALWGFEPLGYHLTNIILHSLNALLLWWLLSRLGIGGAWFAAAIFTLHPVHTESVAWITERKNVLSLAFYLGSILAYLRYALGPKNKPSQDKSEKFRIISLILFLCALSSKTVSCTLPVVLLVVLWWKRGRIGWADMRDLAQFFMLALVWGFFTIWWEHGRIGTGHVDLGLNLIERTLIASRALWFYLGKLIWPANLAFSYRRWNIDATAPLQYGWLLACAIVGWGMWHWRDKLGRGPIAAIVFFVVTLSPMLSFFSLYTFVYTYVADHYQYVASIGPIALVVAVGYRNANRLGRWGKSIAMIVAAFILVIFGSLTWRQSHIYKDLETLWRDTIQKNPDSILAHGNLSCLLSEQDKLDEAASHLRKVLSLDPNDVLGHHRLGLILKQHGKLDAAISHYHKALQIKPKYAKVHNDLGIALTEQGKFDEAISHFAEAWRLKPDWTHMQAKIDEVNQRKKREQAIEQHIEMLRSNPDDPDLHNKLGIAFYQQSKFDQAITHWKEVIRLKPDQTEVYNNLAIVLFQAGEVNQAIEFWTKALQHKSDWPEVHNNLAGAFLTQGNIDEAIAHWTEVLRLRPDRTEIYNNLAIALFRAGEVNQAIEFWTKALQHKSDWPEVHNNLARAFLTQGNIDEAIAHWTEALRLRPGWTEVHQNLSKLLSRQKKQD